MSGDRKASVSDIDLSKLVGLGSKAPSRDKDKDGQKKPTTKGGPTEPPSMEAVRRRIDGQITEYTEGSGEGIPDVEAMLRADPGNVDLQDWLAFLYYTNNRLDEAIELYKKLISASHKPDAQYFYLGNVYYKKGLHQLAIEQWKKSLEISPNGANARKAQARIQDLSG